MRGYRLDDIGPVREKMETEAHQASTIERIQHKKDSQGLDLSDFSGKSLHSLLRCPPHARQRGEDVVGRVRDPPLFPQYHPQRDPLFNNGAKNPKKISSRSSTSLCSKECSEYRRRTTSVTSGQCARDKRRSCGRVLESPRRPSSAMCEQNDKSSRSSLSA